MSTPSHSNIDLWLFELAEGNLSPDQIAKLELFLLQHPDLDVDRDMWELAKVAPEEHIYPGKDSLSKRKPIGLYTAIASVALLILIFVGGLLNYNVPDKATYGTQLVTQVSDLLKENKRLTQEIEVLKRRSDRPKFEKDELRSEETVVPQEIFRIPKNEDFSLEPSDVSQFILETKLESSQPANESYILDQISTVSSKEPEEVSENEVTSNPEELKKVPSKGKNTQHVHYDISFRNRLFKFGKALQKMIDNPVALKNSRDPQYHVPGMMARDINFGATGTMSAPRVEMFSRVQWRGMDNELLQNQLAIDGYSYGVRGGIGVQMKHSYYNDGGIQVSNAAITYSPKLSVNRFFSIEPAFRFKMGNKLLSDSKMENAAEVEIDRGIVHDYYSSGAQPVGSNLWYRDIGFGLNVNTKWFFASAQLDNLLNHKDNIYTSDLSNPRRAGTHFVTSIGTDYESKSTYKNAHAEYGFSSYLMYQKLEQLSELWLGINARWRWLTIGGAMSNGFDPAVSIGFKFKYFLLQYNTDYSLSLMNNKREFSHQLTLRFLGKPSYFKQ